MTFGLALLLFAHRIDHIEYLVIPAQLVLWAGGYTSLTAAHNPKFPSPTNSLGLDNAILQRRSAVYENAKRLNPLRWSGPTRNWSPITEVYLNPKKPTMNTRVEIPIDPGSGHSDFKTATDGLGCQWIDRANWQPRWGQLEKPLSQLPGIER